MKNNHLVQARTASFGVHSDQRLNLLYYGYLENASHSQGLLAWSIESYETR